MKVVDKSGDHCVCLSASSQTVVNRAWPDGHVLGDDGKTHTVKSGLATEGQSDFAAPPSGPPHFWSPVILPPPLLFLPPLFCPVTALSLTSLSDSAAQCQISPPHTIMAACFGACGEGRYGGSRAMALAAVKAQRFDGYLQELRKTQNEAQAQANLWISPSSPFILDV